MTGTECRQVYGNRLHKKFGGLMFWWAMQGLNLRPHACEKNYPQMSLDNLRRK
jgi:hypothetical protein